MHYQWTKTVGSEQLAVDNSKKTVGGSQLTGDGHVSIYRMDVVLVGANKNAAVVFEEPTGYYENYYLAHTGENGVRAEGYTKVIYRNVYPNIDWVVYVNPKGKSENQKVKELAYAAGEEGIKYDFIVHTGGNPADIKLRYEGATELKLVDGKLVATTPYGTITEDAPYSYMAGSQTEVASSYVLHGNELGYRTGSYEGELVIDPGLKWATYYGGNSSDDIMDQTVDSAGNLYIGGMTGSSNNIATNGSTYQTVYAGNNDGFVAKFNINGMRQWGTYYGGSAADRITGVAADTFGNVYAAIDIESSGMGTTGTQQPAFAGSGDMMVVKLNTTTGGRVWASYYGTADVEKASSVTCDGQGNVYIVGSTSGGSNGLATTGAFLTTQYPGIIVSFNPAGQRVWATYFYRAVDCIHYEFVNNCLYIAGETSSISGIATTGTHQTTHGGSIDIYINRFTTGGSRIWGSYYGGSGAENIGSICSDATGNMYLSGSTQSNSNIASTGAHKTSLTAFSHAMLVKFTPAGQRLWGTYYGDGSSGGGAIVTDPRLNVYLFGNTANSTGITTVNGYKTSYGGGLLDNFIAILDGAGNRQWGSYYGGTGIDRTSRNSSYVKGKVYFSGETSSSTDIIYGSSVHQSILAGGQDGYVMQWDVDTLVYIREPYTDTIHCTGDTLHVPYGVTQNFRSGNVFKVQLSNASGSFASPVDIGSVTANTGGVINCPIPGSTAGGNGYRIRIVATTPIDTTQANEYNLRIHPKPANFVAGVNTPVCTADTVKLTSGTTTSGVTYSWTGPNSFTASTANATIPQPTPAAAGNYYITVDNNGCMVKDTLAVTIRQSPQNVTAGSNGPICSGDTMKLTSSSSTPGVSYQWTGPATFNQQNVTAPNAQTSQGGSYKVVVSLNGCKDSATTSMTINQSPFINIVPTTPTSICQGDTAQFLGFPNNAGSAPQLQWQINGIDQAGATTDKLKISTLVNGDKVRLKVIPNSACAGTKYSNEIMITVNEVKTPAVSISANPTPPWNANIIVTFTATPTNGGNKPGYQWQRNGKDIGGATADTWATSVGQLSNNDEICVVMKSDYACPQPQSVKSNCISAAYTGIVGDNINNREIKIYPNPVGSGQLTVDSWQAIAAIELYDVVGQSVSITQLLNGSMPPGPLKGEQVYQLDMSSLPKGNYVLRLTDAEGERMSFKVVK